MKECVVTYSVATKEMVRREEDPDRRGAMRSSITSNKEYDRL